MRGVLFIATDPEDASSLISQSADQLDGYLVGVAGYDRVLLEEAARSAGRSREAVLRSDHRTEAGSAASAILCAAAACETKVSEYIAHWEFASGSLPHELQDVRETRNALQQWNKLVRFISPGTDLGSNREYEALGCLLRARDHIAHRSARLVPIGAWPPRLTACIRQGIIPVGDYRRADWTSLLMTAPVARWAVEVAEAWLDLADELFPLRC